MRAVVLSLTLAALPAAAFADERRTPSTPPPPVVDCRDARITHATRGPSRPQRLAELPDAWRLHAVNRRIGGCTVHPEARKVSSLTGRAPARPPPRP